MRRLAFALAVLLATGAAVQPQGYGSGKNRGQGKPIRDGIHVTATNYRFNPSRIRVKRGQQVWIHLMNNSDHRHNITFQVSGKRYSLKKNLMAGETGTLHF